MKDHVFRVEWGDGEFTLGGRTYRGTTDADVLAVLRTWEARARELGGYLIRRTALEAIVVLPDHVAVEGGAALEPWVAKRG